MTLAVIPDHQEQAIVKLIPPFWGKPRIAVVMLSWLREVQELEDVIAAMILIRELANADNTRLAVLGALVGQGNFGFATETHRRVIGARIATNRSRGIAADILEVAHLLFDGVGDAPLITFQEVGIASILLTVYGDTDDDLTFAAPNNILPDARLGGVSLELFFRSTSDASEAPETFIGGDVGDPTTGTPGWSVSKL